MATCQGKKSEKSDSKRRKYSLYCFGLLCVPYAFYLCHDLGKKQLFNIQKAATERSSAQNKAATGGWRWKDRKGFVDHHFRKLPEICKYNQFRCCGHHPGKVFFVKERLGHEETSFQLLKTSVEAVLSGSPVTTYILQPASLTPVRQDYLYPKVRPFVRPAFRDTFCPEVNAN